MMNPFARFEFEWAVLLAAVALDLFFGEPPNRLHPVVWMGSVTSHLQRFAPRKNPIAQLAFGVFVAALVPTTFAAASAAIVVWAGTRPILGFALSAALLKTTFSVRALG